jgi:hypothetical protein
MRKNGKIPPHFLYFLENEGIELTNFRSSNFAGKDSYDRVLVKFPYSYKTIDIQVIFDNLDYSAPPDFLFLNENNIFIDYGEIIKDWNFKESSTLYNSLNRIKEKYALEQERKFKEELKKSLKSGPGGIGSFSRLNSNINNINLNENQQAGFCLLENNRYESQDLEFMNIFEHIDRIINKLKLRFQNYKQIPRSGTFLDLVLNIYQVGGSNQQGGSNNNNSSKTAEKEQNSKFENHIIISYPYDFLIRSRNLNRSPIINIYIPITYDMRFYVDIKTPHFVSFQDFKYFNNEFYDLKNFNEVLNKLENQLLEYLKELQLRESIINKIIDSNIGFPLEIDTYSYSKLSLYFNYPGSKANSQSASSSFKSATYGQSISSTPGKMSPVKSFTPNPTKDLNINADSFQLQSQGQLLNTNFILFFNFTKDDKKLEFQIINCDILRMIIKKKFDYLNCYNDREMNNLLTNILQTVLDNIQRKK